MAHLKTLLALGIVVLLGCPVMASSPHDGLVEYLDGCLARGDRQVVQEMVRSLEATPLPATPSHEALIESIHGVLSLRGEETLAGRVLRVRRARLARTFVRGLEPIVFPLDHGAHNRCLSEWWYFNGHVTVGGERHGYMITFFKVFPKLNFVHAALTNLDTREHVFHRTFHSPKAAAAATGRLDVRFGKDSVREEPDGRFRLCFTVKGRRLDLLLRPQRAPMMVNGNGLIDMPEGTTSRYYSFTRLETVGTAVWPDGSTRPVEGRSWADHQWGNFVAFFRPWDWFGLQLDDGTDYNIFEFRPGVGFAGRCHVNVLGPDGRLEVFEKIAMARTSWWKSPVSHDLFVTSWALHVPGSGESFTVTTQVVDQEMPRTAWYDLPPAYWEGAVNVVRSGSTTVSGVGFSEHFPYRRPVRTRRPLPATN
ncbi:MAG: hypothetical protein HY815_12210 [Candidatus Riflebacteria bacterium]|nr:hypothetical protein [Candidatus Riflebacteria bacterium]